MERNIEKVDLDGLSTDQAIKLVEGYMPKIEFDKYGNTWITETKKRKIPEPVSWASIPPKKYVPEPQPEPIEPKGWWEDCWLNPWRKDDIWQQNVKPVQL